MKKFMNPEIEVQAFVIEDVVTTSGIVDEGNPYCGSELPGM